MTLHSALEDLQETTLRAFTGCLNRLEYLSGLRDKEGSYFHWGFSRVYGDLAAQKALARAHRSQLSQSSGYANSETGTGCGTIQ